MAQVHFQDDSFDVDAALIAHGLGLEPAQIPTMMRDGQISSRCERGEAEDSGRYRLTFLHGDQRLCLIINERGQVIETSTRTGVQRP